MTRDELLRMSVREQILWRYELLTSVDPDEENELCANDPAAWFDRWVWTYDPRVTPRRRPMILWPKQREYVHWLVMRLRNPGPSTVVKPRDVGASWLNAGFGLWCVRYLPGTSVGYSSRKLMYVESGSPDSTFGKVREIISALPRWMRPDVTGTRSPPIIKCAATGAEMKGEGGDNVGRGGRSTIYFVDEMAYFDRQTAIESAVSESAGSVIYCSTYGSPGDRFHEMTESKQIPCFRFSWWDDPRRDDAWLVQKQATTDPVHFRRDVLCDPYASMSGQLLERPWIDACVELDLGQTGMLTAGYDPAGRGSSEPILCIARGPRVLSVERVPGDSEPARASWVVARSAGCSGVRYDVCGGWGETARIALGSKGIEVNGGSSVPDAAPKRLEMAGNIRAAMYLELRWRAYNSWLLKTGVPGIRTVDCLSLPNDKVLLKQLSSISAAERPGGKVWIEAKEAMRARGLPSPDRADAVGYAMLPAGVLGNGPLTAISF